MKFISDSKTCWLRVCHLSRRLLRGSAYIWVAPSERVVVGTLCAVAIIKAWVAWSYGVSPGAADDYDYLNKAAYFLAGDFQATDYPFTNTPVGILYPLLVSLWVLVDDPQSRMLIPLVINISFAAMTSYFLWRIYLLIGGARSAAALAFFCIYNPVFLMSFYVLTENFFYVGLTLVGLLALQADDIRRSPMRMIGTLLALVALVQIRAPGLAVAMAFAIVLLALARRQQRPAGAVILAIVCLVLPITSYLGLGQLLGGGRESRFLTHLRDGVDSLHNAGYAASWFVAEVNYLHVAIGCFCLPVMLAGLRKGAFKGIYRGGLSSSTARYGLFVALVGAATLLLAVGQLAVKFHYRPGTAFFVYGRYVDPILVLSAPLVLFALEKARRTVGRRAVAVGLVSALLAVASLVLLQIPAVRLSPPNYNGVSFQMAVPPIQVCPGVYVAIAIVVFTLGWSLATRDELRRLVLFGFLISAQVLGIAYGLRFLHKRARLLHRSVAVAEWIQDNVAEESPIFCDATISEERAPRAARRMKDVYRMLKFFTYPRDMDLVTQIPDRATGYFYTATGGLQLPESWRVWSNGSYHLYRLNHAATEPVYQIQRAW